MRSPPALFRSANESQSYRTAALIAHQRDHFSSEALQARDTRGDGLAAEVEDQFVHADSCKGADVTGDILRIARETSADAVAIRNGGVIQRGLVRDGKRREITPLGFGQALQRIQVRPHFLRRQR